MDMDFSLDYLTWQNTEEISIESIRAHGTIAATIPVARRSQVSYREQQPSFGVYIGGDVNFRIPTQFIPADLLPLKPRDRLRDARGIIYTVLQVQPSRNTSAGPQSLKLLCRDLRLAFDLKDLITIETPVRTLDAGHAKLSQFTDKYLLIPARVQLQDQSQVDMAGKRVSQGRYQIFVDRELQVTHEERIKWIPGLVRDPVSYVLVAPDITDVRYLEVTNYRNAESIQELPTIEARDTP